jgi:V/A-type H+-transporting ATPase subunit I
MAITTMKLVNIIADNEHLNEVLKIFIDVQDFHPELASKLAGSVHGLTTLYYENPYLKMLNRIKEVKAEMGLDAETREVDVDQCDLDRINRYVERTHDKFDSIEHRVKEIELKIREYVDDLKQVKNIEDLDIPLEDLFSSRYVASRFGRLPLDSVRKLQFYNNRPFIWNSFSKDNNYSWGVYLTTNEYEREVDNVFTSLYFERLYIPDFVHGTPEKAKENLNFEIGQLKKELEEHKIAKEKLKERIKDRYSLFTSVLEHVSRIFEARKYVLGLGGRFSITGFVPSDKVDDLKNLFNDIESVDIEVRSAHDDMRLSPPTKLRNGWFSKPFGMFVEMYGVPNYGDIDPTAFVAFTYTILFGIMFGDVGQGLVLALIGYLAYKFKGMKLGAVGIRVGFSSAFFGLLYGSVFGNETLLDPLYLALGLNGKPIHTMDPDFTMTLLIAAIAIGSLLIVSTIGINIYINFKRKHFAEMVLSHNGIAGILMYGFIVVSAGLILLNIADPLNIVTIGIFVVIPLLAMFLKEPIERKLQNKPMFPDGFGGFFTEAFFELFEIILSYITNTMSYMRVAGFVLSHAGMMLVVYSLMEMTGSGGPIVFVIGNIFVMALEGLIVGIQVLRLEFYEMFSRYYTGDGIAFKQLNETL